MTDYYIKLENLLKGRENASIIDLKMGTCTITHSIKSEERLKKRKNKDKVTTSEKLGFKVIGYVVKSNKKEVEEKFYKFPYKKEKDIPSVLQKIFRNPKASQFHDEEENLPKIEEQEENEKIEEEKKVHEINDEFFGISDTSSNC